MTGLLEDIEAYDLRRPGNTRVRFDAVRAHDPGGSSELTKGRDVVGIAGSSNGWPKSVRSGFGAIDPPPERRPSKPSSGGQ